MASDTGTVADISDADLVERVMRNLWPRKPGRQLRWAAVSDAFALGSTYSQQLCWRFGLDPHEMIGIEEEASDGE